MGRTGSTVTSISEECFRASEVTTRGPGTENEGGNITVKTNDWDTAPDP